MYFWEGCILEFNANKILNRFILNEHGPTKPREWCQNTKKK